MDETQSHITTIPGISVRMGAMIVAEIGDFSRKVFGLCRYVTVYLPIRATLVIRSLFPYGETRLQVSTRCDLQCNQMRLPLGSTFSFPAGTYR